MEKTSVHGNKTGFYSIIVLLLLVCGVTFASFKHSANQELSLSRKKYTICKAENNEANQLEISGEKVVQK